MGLNELETKAQTSPSGLRNTFEKTKHWFFEAMLDPQVTLGGPTLGRANHATPWCQWNVEGCSPVQ